MLIKSFSAFQKIKNFSVSQAGTLIIKTALCPYVNCPNLGYIFLMYVRLIHLIVNFQTFG
jgi:hypothetical protein